MSAAAPDATSGDPPHPVPGPATKLLREAETGQPGSTDALLELVYAQLRATAQRLMAAERPGHTLSATVLVHEAYARLVGDEQVAWSGRAHFYAAAAQAMRRVLIDHARGRGRLKRGGKGEAGAAVAVARVNLELQNVAELAATDDPNQILALDDAIRRLEIEEPDLAGVVRLRFFAGLTVDDTANALAISPRQVDRLWGYARARLARMLQEGGAGAASD
jgi:RNA polymerase sigma factor (TIGR02999 family)